MALFLYLVVCAALSLAIYSFVKWAAIEPRRLLSIYDREFRYQAERKRELLFENVTVKGRVDDLVKAHQQAANAIYQGRFADAVEIMETADERDRKYRDWLSERGYE